MAAAMSPRIAASIATDLDDVQIWAEIQRIALAVANITAEGAASSCSATEYAGVRNVTVAGTGYIIRAQSIPSGSQSIVVVALERTPAKLPSNEDLQGRFGLTQSEAKVAILLADRKSNREIAAVLGVTQHTARRHTEHVLSKLEIRRRTSVRESLMTHIADVHQTRAECSSTGESDRFANDNPDQYASLRAYDLF